MDSQTEELLAGLDAEQRQVATTFGNPVVVIAGAGTGKTRALTHRIAYGAASGAYSPNAVLALTFTTRAAGELRTRLRGLGLPAVQARTFHSAALRQAQFFWPRAYGSELPPVSAERISMVAAAARKLRLAPDTGQLRDLLTEVSWAKVSNVAPAEYAAIALGSGREVSGVSSADVGKVLGGYERVKAERGVIDFDDILLCAVAVLGENDDIAKEVRNTYRHLLVDEYQDVSPIQQTLLDLWWSRDGDNCVVGDPAQTIHSFAGATPEFLNSFQARHRGSALIRLVRDYRSTPQVVALANRVSRNTGIGAVTLEAQRPDGAEPRIIPCANELDEAALAAKWLDEQHEAGLPWRELAVLYRVHAQSPLFEAALAQAQIPFTVRGTDGFYQRGEVRQVIGELATRAQKDGSIAAVDACRSVLAKLGWSETAPTGQGRVRERWESLSAVLALAEDLAQSRPGADLAALAAELEQRATAEHPLNADGVTLSTLHAAKGLEWSGVVLVGAQEGTLPFSLASGPAQVAEEARLFYVGITRAKQALLISWSRARRSGAGNRQPSRFLDGIAARPAGEPARRGPRAKARTALTDTCRVCGRPLSTGAERKLARHADCPASYDEAVYDQLVAWRLAEAKQRSLPAYCVFTDATLMAIAERNPADDEGLLAVPGVGRAKLEQYGQTVLGILGGADA
ncbi:ATP-dependent DNA helicase UvrD2 [Propionicimonas sp.]|uniref:ATP-dependent DNA helicase UvrD2 n=1 Tax=Propionicimonas sp. TaxID=1955623 RepID=UPI00183546A8|nr:ATP-dependent DNA helicase UvrD2 [Propionicimonas sp.]MBU3977519.1 ATP-dependent DNA helicase UvrD2 [Actinomycetota bacterium]MBA3021444.1 ATP-dependent DNA helicase UvrD2 [Propionicimonas sp.]MBU3986029.1 ATP-dependent DNA helicase UvrD2 [Actinomycetota bacterium]MBU4008814.1 ATP-dependent DNA helicase UvrD2 [Actinomycetota bacterium]MBU4066036.1 ATP-dependent DNA helicase UvrD2 [Actinomycetota bacterium]